MAKLSEAEIAKTIYPAGFYNIKAANIIAASRLITTKYEGSVPSSMEELLSLLEWAERLQIYIGAWVQDSGICVDTHVHRLQTEWGLSTRKLLKTEFALMDALPEKHWIK